MLKYAILSKEMMEQDITDQYMALAEAQSGLLENQDIRKASLKEIQGRKDLDPNEQRTEIDNYKIAIRDGEQSRILLKDKITRIDKMRSQKEFHCLVITPETSTDELSVCMNYIEKELKHPSTTRQRRALLSDIYENMESWKGILSNNLPIKEDIRIPLLDSEHHHGNDCDVLIQLAGYQASYEKGDAKAKYAIFIQVLESNINQKFNSFLEKVIQDNKFISPPDVLKKIKDIYSMLFSGINKGQFSKDELNKLTQFKDEIKNLVKEQNIPIDAEQLQTVLNDKTWLFVSKLSLKADSLSSMFKQFINEICRQVKITPPFLTTEVTQNTVKSLYQLKQEFAPEETPGKEVSNPLKHQ